jgi:hypothetical protein
VRGAATTIAVMVAKVMKKERVLISAPVLRRFILLDETELI